MMKRYSCSILLALSVWLLADNRANGQSANKTAQHPYVSKAWVSDNGDGTYKNPVLYADYSDPDAIRVEDDYYMTASSFNCMPGLPILHSKDLVNWELINHAIKKQLPDNVYASPQHGKGVWAPSIRFHQGEYYIYYPDPDYGIFMVRSKDIRGTWSDPVLVLKGKGIIDPCPLWDTDGKAYLIAGWAASRAGVNSLLTVYRLNPEGTRATDEGKHVFDGHDDQQTVEGPKFYKRNGYYYIFAPAGGVVNGWQLVLRSKDVYGPYEEKVVMDQGSTNVNGPHQGAWVETVKGDSWFLHFQDKGAYGRIMHLEPMTWVNNWPVIGIDKNKTGRGEPVLTFKKPDVGRSYSVTTPAESDEFNSDNLGLQWQWQANPMINWYALMRGSGYLRLFAYPQRDTMVNLWETPNLLLQKIPAPDFSVITKLKYTVEWDAWQGKKAGLIIMGNDYAYISISKDENGYLISQVTCKKAASNTPESVMAQKRLTGSSVFLKVSVSAPDALCRFSYSEDGRDYIPLGETFTARQDLWTGAKVGIFCTGGKNTRIGGFTDFDWFRVVKN